MLATIVNYTLPPTWMLAMGGIALLAAVAIVIVVAMKKSRKDSD